jgi:ABC-type Mn2+/Zn2+ transport system permease subunit
VIEAFLDSWPLFQTTYLAGWSIAVGLSLVGVWVVARDQIFLGVSVAQASTLGVATALWLGEVSAFAGSLAVAASIATALLTARYGGAGRESPEAVTGWVFLLAASLPVLLLADSPHGLEEVHALVFSTILGASRTDLGLLAGLAAATVLAVARYHRALLLFAMDPEMASAVGMRRRLWTALVAVWLGLAVGLSIRVGGTLYAFGCLVLPALVARNLCREVRGVLVLAPVLALAAAVCGFVAAHSADTPPAHTTVALLCALLLLSWPARRWRSR